MYFLYIIYLYNVCLFIYPFYKVYAKVYLSIRLYTVAPCVCVQLNAGMFYSLRTFFFPIRKYTIKKSKFDLIILSEDFLLL